MSRAVCPGLERTASGYVCTYAQRPINPFQWYCFGDYFECPIYVQYMRTKGAQVKAETKPHRLFNHYNSKPSSNLSR